MILHTALLCFVIFQGRHIQYRGHKFLKYLKEKTQKEFLEFANILSSKGYLGLGQEMKNMIQTPIDLKKTIKADVEERVETSLRGTRISENKKQAVALKVADYIQAKAYEWQKYTDSLRMTIIDVNENIEDMCAKVIKKAKVLDVPFPADEPPIKQLDTCVKTMAETCNQLYEEMQKLQNREEEHKLEKAHLNQIIANSVHEVDGQKQRLEKTRAELDRIKSELDQMKSTDMRRVKLIEEMKKQIRVGEKDVGINMNKLRELQMLEERMNETQVDLAALNQTVKRKNKKINELEQNLEQCYLEIDFLKAKLKEQKDK